MAVGDLTGAPSSNFSDFLEAGDAPGKGESSADRIDLDGISIRYAQTSLGDFRRASTAIRADGLNAFGLCVPVNGAITGLIAETAFLAPPRSIVLFDLSRPFQLKLAHGRAIRLTVPREVAEDNFDKLGRLHGLVIDPASSALFVDFLMNLQTVMPSIAERQQTRLARTILDLLAIALDSTRLLPAHDPASVTDPAAVARRVIAASLGSDKLSIPELCATLRTSRSTLYRMFEPDGGVKSYIRRQRIERVCQALLDPENSQNINDLAHLWGFSDASHLARQFREVNGMTPGRFRATRGGLNCVSDDT